ncbi:hypothetical protein ASD79_06350 [Caulobacter sp. Root655]|uniref:hypothetical protein n=1 Tax=Caulobacter sp. Root655 TaxID=1736578 RepID=UPI0006FEBF50|nr:hypothetical protein [Caulobacter sp. Root655]KRA61727.1 hypothetical protein ASD79_06350 [Caulobacter sp. Root655]
MFGIRFVKLGHGSERFPLVGPVLPDEQELWLAIVAGRAMLGSRAPEADGFEVFLRESGELVQEEWL